MPNHSYGHNQLEFKLKFLTTDLDGKDNEIKKYDKVNYDRIFYRKMWFYRILIQIWTVILTKTIY
jgi:hypothetical protein